MNANVLILTLFGVFFIGLFYTKTGARLMMWVVASGNRRAFIGLIALVVIFFIVYLTNAKP